MAASNTELSGPHRQVLKWLEESGYACSSEFPIPPYYHLDIYLKDYHVAIEVDGPMHSRPSDARRDAYMLSNFGIPTLRINARKKLPSKEEVLESVENFCDAVVDSFVARKKLYRKGLQEIS